MEKDDLIPGQQGEELELEPSETGDEPKDDGQGSDPLDEIQDIEVLRSEAKKQRAIANRNKKPKQEVRTDELKEDKKPESGDYLKRSDFELANQREAIRLVTITTGEDSEDIATMKKDLQENWDQVRQFYVSRRGKMKAEDIVEDIKDAYLIFKNRRTPAPAKSDTTDLAATRANGTNKAPSKEETKKSEPKNFKEASSPEDWY